MLWIRKGIIGLLSLVLLISLLGLAFTSGLSMAFSQPKHLTTWVEKGDFYSTLTNIATKDANKAVGNATGISGSTFAKNIDTDIRQSFVSAYPETEFNQDVSTFINSNYAWLKGQSTTPNFRINIAQIKSGFASAIGSAYVADLKKLPACTTEQESALQSSGTSALTCLPTTINLSAIQSQIASEVNSSNIVLSKSVVNANDVLQRSNGQPYYTRPGLTKAYKHLAATPIAFAVIALICASCIFFGSLRKSKALRKISVASSIAGIILLVCKLLSNKVSTEIAKHADKNSTLSQFRTPVENVAREIVSYLGKIDMLFGIIYIVIAIALIGLLLSRHRMGGGSKPKSDQSMPLEGTAQGSSSTVNQEDLGARLNVRRQSTARTLPTAPTLKPRNPNNKDRLIQ